MIFLISFISSSTQTTFDRPALTVFSLDTGCTFTLKLNEHLYSIEPASLKQYPPLATEIILCYVHPLDQITMTFTKFTVETLRSLTLNEIFMGRIKLATRSCFWIDPLVRPVRLAALKRIAYDKPIRKQLILAKLIQSNDDHMRTLDRLAVESKLKDVPVVDEENVEDKTDSPDQEEPVKQPTESEEASAEFVPIFKPFLNRTGQLIINPVGRSKEFFAKHHQQFRSDFVKPLSSVTDQLSSLIKDDPPRPSSHQTSSEVEPSKEEEEDIYEVSFLVNSKAFHPRYLTTESFSHDFGSFSYWEK